MHLFSRALAALCFVFLGQVFGSDLDSEYQFVTFRSAIKLTHSSSGYRLHSHSVAYGSGSGQQSVTAFPGGNDPNSLFVVKPSTSDVFSPDAARGKPVKCDATIRLLHSGTKKYLHSHLHTSPLSLNQEVSAFGGEDTGDNWRVKCLEKNAKYWTREKKIRLVHVDTNTYLTSNERYKYRNPIPGQLEVYTVKSASDDNTWIAQEGLYFANVDMQ